MNLAKYPELAIAIEAGPSSLYTRTMAMRYGIRIPENASLEDVKKIVEAFTLTTSEPSPKIKRPSNVIEVEIQRNVNEFGHCSYTRRYTESALNDVPVEVVEEGTDAVSEYIDNEDVDWEENDCGNYDYSDEESSDHESESFEINTNLSVALERFNERRNNGRPNLA